MTVDEIALTTACAYCRDMLPPGAKVCRSCARRQPMSADMRQTVLGFALLGAFFVGIFSFVGYVVYVSVHEDNIAEMAAGRAKLCGSKSMTKDEALYEMHDLHDKGVSRDSAEKTVLWDSCPAMY